MRTTLFGVFLILVTGCVLVFDRCAPRPEQVPGEDSGRIPGISRTGVAPTTGQLDRIQRAPELARAFPQARAVDQAVLPHGDLAERLVLWQTEDAEHPLVMTGELFGSAAAAHGNGQPLSWSAFSADRLLLSNRHLAWTDAGLRTWLEARRGQADLPPQGIGATTLPIQTASIAAYLEHLQASRRAVREAGFEVSVQRNLFLFPATATPDDPRFGEQWALQVTRASEAWARGSGSAEVIVGIIDSGLDFSHPDLLNTDGSANVWQNPHEIPDNGIDDDGNGFVDDVSGWDFVSQDAVADAGSSHGPRMAGVIGAAGNNGYGISGINQRVSLLPLKVGTAVFSFAAVIQAIDYAIQLRAAGHPLLILSNSYGLSTLSSQSEAGDNEALLLAVQRSHDAGILFVAASGNNVANLDLSGSVATAFIPASFALDSILSVTATTSADGLWSAANYGSASVDVGAPGVSILSTAIGGGHTFGSGTSEACAFAAGSAALVLAANPALDYRNLKAILMQTGTPLDSLAGNTLTGRRIDLAEAVEEALRYPSIDWLLAPLAFAQADWPLELLLEALPGSDPIAAVRIAGPDAAMVSATHIGSAIWAAELIPDSSGKILLHAEAEDSAGRRISSPATGVEILAAQNYWLRTHFGEDFAPQAGDDWWSMPLPPSGTAPIEAFLLGNSPHGVPSSAPPFPASPRIAFLNDRPAFDFPLNLRARPLSWQLEGSSDLQQWAPVTGASAQLLATDPASDRILLRLGIPPADPARFFRLKVDWATLP